MRRVAIAALKGGTGKTTTAVSLAHALALGGQRVLLIDCDPRRQASQTFGLAPEPGLAAWLQGRPARAIEVRAGLRVLDSGGAALAQFERTLAASPHAAACLRHALDTVTDTDWVLVDCGPGAGALQDLVLGACDEILLPVGADYLALAQAGEWVDTLEMAARRVRLLATFAAAGSASNREIERVLAERFAALTLQTRISDADGLRCAPARRGTIFDSEPLSRSALEYALLAEECTAHPVVTP